MGDGGLAELRHGAAHGNKNGRTHRKSADWVLPPQAAAELVAHREAVRATDEKPDEPAGPVLGLDDQPVQWRTETRVPLPATAQHGQRGDSEYERAGTATIFLCTEPLAGWREVAGRETKTQFAWAPEMARLLEGRYAQGQKVLRGCDNLNTHPTGACSEAFAPARARQLVRRIESGYPPKHGSWLNLAANELSSLTRQCSAGRRFGDVDTRLKETSAWSSDVNDTQRGVDWQLKIEDARCKLKSVYPKIKL